MKSTSTLRHFLCIASSAVLAISSAQAATLTWDAGGGGGAITNGGGAWLGANLWNDGGVAATWTSGDDAIFAGPATNGGAVTLASPTTVNSITFSPSFNSAYTLGTAGQAITLNNGITMNASAGSATFVSPIILGGGQSWTINSTSALTLNSTLNLNGNALSIGGSGTTRIAGAAAAVISGAGGISLTGGRLVLGDAQVPVHTYSGDTTLSGNSTLLFSNNLSANSNINLNGGVLESYWSNGLTRTIGTGATQIRVTGGESGFALNGSTGATFTLGALTWGTTNFDPSKLLLQNANSQGSSALILASAINLNGANRTIVASSGVAGTATSTISGVISNSTGTAGLIKEGAGLLALSATNTYNGGTTISAGTLAFGSIAAMPNSGAVAVNNATLGVEVGAAGDWTGSSTVAVGTLGGLLGGLGGAGSSTVGYTGNVGLRLTMTANTTYSGNIANVGTSLALTKLGGSSLTLSGNNTYSGGTTLAAGALAVGSANALGTGTVALNGGTIQSDSATARTLSNALTIGGDFTVGGTGNMTFSNTGATALSATRTIQVANGITAEFAQAFTGTGGISKGTTIGGVLKLSGTSSYTGATTVNDNAGGYNVLEVTVMANGGSNSSVGASSNAAANLTLKNGTALRYVGSTNASTDRAIKIDSGTIGHGAIIESSGTGTLSFTNTAVANTYGTGNQARYLTFGGTNTGNNTYGKIIANNGASGTMTVNKEGAGTWKLSGANVYTGNTTISNGTLLLGANNVLPDTTNVVIGTATLDADTRTDTVGTLDATGNAVINLGTGAALAFANSSGVTGGVWAGALNITGTFVSGNDVDPGLGVNPGSIRFGVNSSCLTASQLADITVNGGGTYTLDAFGYLKAGAGGDPYTTWSGGAAFSDDANNDGVDNGMAWVLGALDKDANAIGLLPTFDNTTDPDFFIFTYRRDDDANTDVNTTIKAEYGSDLAGWTPAVAGVDIIITPTDDGAGVGIDSVQVKIRRTLSVGGKLFARLNAVKAP